MTKNSNQLLAPSDHTSTHLWVEAAPDRYLAALEEVVQSLDGPDVTGVTI